MIYLQPRRKRSLSGVQLRIGVLIVLCFLGAALVGSYVLQGTLQTIAYPFMHISKGIGGLFGGVGSVFQTKLSLSEENTKLKQELRTQSHLIARERILMRENDELKEMLGRSVSEDVRLATILSRPPFMMYDTLIIDLGLGSAIEVGDRVYVKGDIAIGEVTAVYPQTSLVTLFSSPDRELQVRVGTTTLTAKGRGLGNYLLEVPRTYIIATGTEVVLPALLPSLLGVVDTVEAHPADPVQYVYVRAPLSLGDIYFVTIVKRSLITKDALHDNALHERATTTASTTRGISDDP
jgi:cell shape-determining protein MreC